MALTVDQLIVSLQAISAGGNGALVVNVFDSTGCWNDHLSIAIEDFDDSTRVLVIEVAPLDQSATSKGGMTAKQEGR